MVEHSAVNRVVVGSSPTRGVFFIACMAVNANYGSMVKRLRHRPFTAVTGVQIPLESFFIYRIAENGKSRKMKHSHIKRDVLTENGKSRAFKKSLRDALD